MAVAFDRKLGETNAGSGFNCSITSVSLTAGEFVVIWVACDNAGITLPANPSIIWDGVGQTETTVASHAAASSTADAATRGYIVIVPSVDHTATGTLTVNFSTSVSKSVAVAAVFTGVTSTVSAGPDGLTGTAATGFTATANDLMLAMTSCEDNAAMTKDTDTTNGAWVEPGGDGAVFTTGGGGAANVTMICGYKIPTAGGTQLWTGGGFSGDGGSCSVQLQAAAAGTNLVVADGAHSHAADGVVLTQVHTAVVAEARSTHAADNVALTQVHNVAIQDSTHGHTADNVAVTVVTNLVVADSTHGHTADNIAVTQVHNLTVAEARSTHAADNVSITQVHNVTIAEARSTHAADNVPIVQNSNLVIADALHGHTVDNVTITVVSALVIADATHGHSADSIFLSQAHNVVLADSLHGHTADNVVIQAGSTLVVADGSHAHSADNIGLTQVHILVVQESSHAHLGDNVTISAGDILNFSLFVADGHHYHSADNLSLSQVHVLTLQEASHLVSSDPANVDENTPVYILILPVTPEHYRFPHHAVDRVGVALGITVYRKDGTWYAGRNLRPSALEGADLVYRGGYDNVVEDPAVRAELQALGYSFETRYV